MTAKTNVKKTSASLADTIREKTTQLGRVGQDLRDVKILLPLILGAAIRFALAPFTEQRWDMYIWRLNQVFVYNYHVNPFWPSPGAPLEFAWGYPPLWLFVLLLVYPFFTLVSHVSYPQSAGALWNPYPWANATEFFESYRRFIPLNLPVLDLIIKTPIIIADLCVSIFVYKLVKSMSNEKYARYAAWAWLLNPYVIWVSSVWGEFDAIATLFVVISVYYLIKKELSKSALMLSIGTLFKLYSIILIPVFALIAFKRSKKIGHGLRYCLIAGGIALSTLFFTYVAFAASFGQSPLSLSVKLTYNLLVKRASPDWMGQNFISGFTPLILLNGMTGTTNIPVSPILMSIALIIILISIWKTREFSGTDIVSYAAVSVLVIYMTYTVVNPQYFIWILPLVLILISKEKSFLKYFYWAISVLGIIAIMYSTVDLSYNISPYFVSEYLGIRIPLELLATSIGLTVVYAIGIKLVLRKPHATA